MTTIPTQVHFDPETSKSRAAIIVLLLLIGALAVRCLYFPGDAFRKVEEPAYSNGGLMLAEGLNPSFKVAPGAPLVWTGWKYGMYKALGNYFNPADPERDLPPKARFTGAINAAIFDIYRDGSGLRKVQLIEAAFFGLLAVYGAARFGILRGGTAGGLLLGGVVAFYPLYVSSSLQTTPYIHAWALAICAIYLAACGGGQSRRWGYVLMGLSIASRLEMVMLLPLMVWESWAGLPDRKLIQALKYVLFSIVIALAAAPWVLVSLLTVLGTVFREHRIAYLYSDFSFVNTLDVLSISSGLIPSIALLLIGLLIGLRWQGTRVRFIWLTLILLVITLTGWNSLSGYITIHAPIILSILLMSVYGIRVMGRAWQPYLSVIAIGAIGFGIVSTHSFSDWRTPVGTAQPVAHWIEDNIVPGSPIYWDSRSVQTLLPTQSAADSIWQDGINSEWKRKLGWMMIPTGAATQPSLVMSDPPRAMSLDLIPKELSVARMYFILGGRETLKTPRFDIWPRYGNDFRGMIPLDARFKRDGGIYVLTTTDPVDDSLGVPLQTFSDAGNAPTYVWVSSLTYVKAKK